MNQINDVPRVDADKRYDKAFSSNKELVIVIPSQYTVLYVLWDFSLQKAKKYAMQNHMLIVLQYIKRPPKEPNVYVHFPSKSARARVLSKERYNAFHFATLSTDLKPDFHL